MVRKPVKLFGAAVLALFPVVASAQSWSFSTNPDIYNTNLGKVGIGSSSAPETTLDVFGEITTRGSNAYFRWAPRSGSGLTMAASNPSGTDLRIFADSNLPIATFKADGKVGIGTTNPILQLDVRTGRTGPGEHGDHFAVGSASDGWGFPAALLDAYDDSVSLLPMVYNASKHVFWNGNVGIGATTPTGLLQIERAWSNSPARFVDGALAGIGSGVLLEMADGSEIHVANLQIGKAITPVIQTTGGANVSQLYLNKDSDNDVVIGGNPTPHGHGLIVKSTGPSSFAGTVQIGTIPQPSGLTVYGPVTGTRIFKTSPSGFQPMDRCRPVRWSC